MVDQIAVIRPPDQALERVILVNCECGKFIGTITRKTFDAELTIALTQATGRWDRSGPTWTWTAATKAARERVVPSPARIQCPWCDATFTIATKYPRPLPGPPRYP